MSWIAFAIGGAALTAGAGGFTAYSQYQQGAAQKRYYDYQSQQSILQGEASLAAAQQQSNLVQDQQEQSGKQLAINQAKLQGAQTVAMATNGTQNGVTAQDIKSDTLTTAQQDEAALRYNADTKSWSIVAQGNYDKFAADQQAIQDRYAGKNALQAGKIAAVGTLLSTAASVASFAGKSGTSVKK